MEKGKIIPVKNFEEGDKLESEITSEGSIKFKKSKEVKKGRKSKSKGALFESKVRKDLEEKEFVVDKWSNNIDLKTKKTIPAKRKYNPFSKVMAIGTGFPDFIAIKLLDKARYDVIGVEVKFNGLLSRDEKQKCKIYLEKNIFSKILIAKKTKEKGRVRIEYIDFEEIEKRMRQV